MTFDLWPADSKYELDLYFSRHLPTHQKYSKSVQHFWSYCAGNQFEYELWPLTFDLRTPNSNLTCILESSTYISKNIKNPSKIFEVIMRKPIWIYNELWPLTCGLRIRTWPVFWCHLPTSRKYPKSVQDFWSYCAETNSGDGRTDGRTGATHNAPSRLRPAGA